MATVSLRRRLSSGIRAAAPTRNTRELVCLRGAVDVARSRIPSAIALRRAKRKQGLRLPQPELTLPDGRLQRFFPLQGPAGWVPRGAAPAPVGQVGVVGRSPPVRRPGVPE